MFSFFLIVSSLSPKKAENAFWGLLFENKRTKRSKNPQKGVPLIIDEIKFVVYVTITECLDKYEVKLG